MNRFLLALAASAFSAGAMAQDATNVQFSFGDDEYAAGQSAIITGAVAGDAFATGYDAKVLQTVTGDAHLAGFNVGVEAGVGGDVYAAGFAVTIGAPVGADLSAMGNSVSVLSGATIGGNARLAGQTVTLGGPVNGSVLIAAQTATLAASVMGDMQFSGISLNFSDGARVDGTLTIRAPRAITVPATVASADRVVFVLAEDLSQVSGPAQVAFETVRSMSPWIMIVPALIWNVALLVVGLVCFALFPKRSAAIYEKAVAAPWYTLWVGVLGLSVMFGLFAVLGMSLIGIPLILIYVFVFAIAWVLMQVAGAYVLGGRILAAFKLNAAPIATQMLGLFIGLVIVWVLGLVPFLGSIVWFVVALLGIGGIARTIVERNKTMAPTASAKA
ncbi:MAG: hypothetical protein WEB63_12285 [Cucumibacter sp.]